MDVKNVVITGGSRGIGHALAIQFLKAGHNVFVIARSEDKLKELSKWSKGNQYKYAVLDLTEVDKIERLPDFIKDWNRVDVLYNNAGLLIKKPFSDLTADDFINSWKVNFLAPTMLIKSLLPKMDKHSHVVNISTIGAIQGSVKFPELTAYGSSKGALISQTEILAQEFDITGPRLNCVALGAVQTEMLEEAFPGYRAPVTAVEMSEFLMNFGLTGHQYMNGKIVQCSLSTP